MSQGKKYLKTKIKFYNKAITANFKNVENTKPPKVRIRFGCLSAIIIDSVFKSGKN